MQKLCSLRSHSGSTYGLLHIESHLKSDMYRIGRKKGLAVLPTVEKNKYLDGTTAKYCRRLTIVPVILINAKTRALFLSLNVY